MNAYEESVNELKAENKLLSEIIAKLTADRDVLLAALREIEEYDPEEEHGFVDEWEEARAFRECQKIAQTATPKVQE